MQYRSAALLLLCILVALVGASKPNEELRGYSIITLSPVNETESIALRKLLPDIDILSHVGTLVPGAHTDAMISPLDLEKLQTAFPSLKYQIKVNDMAEYLRNHEKQVREAEDRWSHGNNRQKRGENADGDETVTFFDNYRSFDHIKQYLAGLQRRWPNLIRSIKIGESIEKNELLVYVVTNNNSTAAAKRKVLFNGGQHAREWLAFSSVLYSMTQLLLDNERDPTLLNEIEFHFIPVMNPDGYEYSRLRARMWRKNRRQNPGSRSIGVDLNRNWPFAYGTGASSSPSSDIYKGTAALSEPETKAVDDYIKRNGYSFRAHVDFHCYGRDILRRYASSNAVSPDDSLMKEVGDAARDNISRGTGVTYVSARGSYLGLDGGCMPDRTYDEYGMISYTIELSDGDFVLPPSEIRPTGKQALIAITTIANFARQGRLDASVMQWTGPTRTGK